MTDAVVLDFSGMFESKPKGPPPKRKAKPAAEAPPLPAAGAPPVLTLQQFGSAPKVDFGDAPAGAVTSRTLVVDNDGSLAKRLEVKGIEKRDALRVYPSSFEVAAGARREVTVSWTPAKEGVLSKKLEFSCNGGHVVHAQLVGACKRAGRPAMVKTAAPAAGTERIPLSPNDANRGKSFSQGPAQRALALKADVVVAPPKPVVAAPPKPKPAPKPAAAPAAAAAPPGGRLVLKKPAAPKAPPKPAAAPPAVPAEAASGGRFYDEQWREKREHGFVEWTNYMLCEPALSTAPAQLDAGERQRLSLRQLEQQRQEAVLRRRATLLLRGATLRPVLTKVEQNVEDGLLAIKASANLAADVGMRDNLLNLLGCYNPLWLRLAAEAVSGEMLPAGTAADDAVALRRFVDRRLLQPPPAAIEAPPVGMHPAQAAKHAAAAAQGAAHKAIVRRVLSLVVLLDAAKEGAILTSDPCLFCPDSHFKSSKALAQEFAKQYLSGGVGELVKHLKTLGYELAHSQTALHEYNFRLTSLASDLRDGARLCRLVELIAPPAALEKARARALKANKGVLRPRRGCCGCRRARASRRCTTTSSRSTPSPTAASRPSPAAPRPSRTAPSSSSTATASRRSALCGPSSPSWRCRRSRPPPISSVRSGARGRRRASTAASSSRRSRRRARPTRRTRRAASCSRRARAPPSSSTGRKRCAASTASASTTSRPRSATASPSRSSSTTTCPSSSRATRFASTPTATPRTAPPPTA